MTKLDQKALAFAIGIVLGLYMLFLGIAAKYGRGANLVEMISSVYIGFEPTILGAFVGAAWGCLGGALAGVIIAKIYNSMANKRS